MSEGNALFQAVLASPEDTTLRLIYADWLDEQNDPRGEFIRIVLEMSRTPVCSAHYRKLRYRRDRISNGCDNDWLKIMRRTSFSEIRYRVEELDRLDPNRKVFASNSHRYRLNPSLTIDLVEQIESRLGGRLPEQYRRFVTEFADGGAGPAYGIRPLASLFEIAPGHEWFRSLATPFSAPTNLEEMRSLGYEASGALPICELGCGGYYHLILTGPEKGNVWIQHDDEWRPALLTESHLPSGPDVEIDTTLEAAIRSPQALKLEFVDWYLKWLDEALWQVSCRSTPADDLFDLDPETAEVSASGRELTTLPDRLRLVTGLRSLNLHGNSLTSLPNWIGDFEKLEFLEVGDNPLTSLPESIGGLSRLKRFSCSHSDEMERLPDSIGRLAELEVLSVCFTALKAIPNSIGNLSNLRELDLSYNQLASLPDTIGELRRLRQLELTCNKLSHLPPSVANLSQLQMLELRANQFLKLPDSIGLLPVLHTLNLGENPGLDLADTCRQLARVSTLRHLWLFGNKLTELPEEIGLLTQLTSLDLSWNQLTTLPTSLARLTNLETLTLDHNPDLTALRVQQQNLRPNLE